MSDKPTIEERENGPLLVKNLRAMKGPDGEAVEAKPVMALCRCGASKNKPFCDGTHREIGFESRGGTPAGRDRLIAYEGADVTVTFNPRVCGHAGECWRLASHVFDANKRPWIEPDNGSFEEIEAVIRACPSGALALKRADGVREHRLAERCDVEVEKNGPYWVTGVEPPVPVNAEGMSSRKYVLCRCGKSGNKPFCDGTHRDEGWSDE